VDVADTVLRTGALPAARLHSCDPVGPPAVYPDDDSNAR
jgi:hypothetical protein